MAELQFVVFKLGKEEYGVNIMQVQEIGHYSEPVKVPNTPEFVEGIMNLRDNVIPVISLRKRFNIPEENLNGPERDLNENRRTIIINLGDRQIAFIVDDASEVLTLDEAGIQETPDIIAGVDRKYISGIGKKGNRLIIMLDLNFLFDEQEQAQLAAI
ncbi:MAG TPA: chemotaxis protein CheW [Bacillota bacterium]|mgnify:FL=1|nr:chemotaxis protein CheW [Bacillota bacterium]HNT02147.1 chemotaxis protein CheW [Bacillota bacterium]HOH88881.1 chemotaxis protein CheW [Bacillota bacterium]HPA54298.1 chemotaxis protein CheW [Bacillota bacterium]HPX68595.1 chemotaxis protein CheW [Bacillota bacterium]